MFFRIFLCICIFFSFSNSFADGIGQLDSSESDSFIQKAEIMLSQLRPLADYMNRDSNNMQDEQLSLLRKEVYADYAELTKMEEQLDSTILQRERELSNYKDKLSQNVDLNSYQFKNKVVERRYRFLINDLNSLIEAKVYIGETKELLDLGITKLSETRIQTRNKDYFEKDDSLINYTSWVKGFKEIKANFHTNEILPVSIVVIVSIVIYNICLLFLSLSFRFVKANLSTFKDRKILHKISIFLRLFWCVFVASGTVIILNKTLLKNIAFNDIVYMICIYFIVQNTMVISLRVFGIYLSKKSLRLMRSLVLLLVFLLTIQSVHFFSLATNITPMFDRNGTTILSFLISIAFVFVVFRLNKRIYSARVSSLSTAVFLTFFRLILMAVSVIYLLLAFLGRDNLATGIVLDVLQVQLIFVAGYSIYSLLAIWIYFISAKLRKIDNYGEEVVSKVRSSSNELASEYWLRILLMLSICLVCVVLTFMVLGVPYQRVIAVIYNIFFEGFDINGEKHFAVFGMLKSILILVGLLILSKLIQKAAAKNILPYTGMDIGTQRAIQTAIGYIGIFISLLVFIFSFGIDGTSLAFIVSGLSVGFGFAMQDLVKNFFAGLTLLAERPIKVGDWINIHGEIGEVKKIRIRSTVIETFNNNTLIIPNGLFMNEIVSNETFNPMSRMVLQVGVSFDSDVQLVTKELLDIAAKHKDIYTNPEPYVIFEDYGEYALRFSLRAYCSKVIQFETESEIREIIVNRFRELGIEIPIKSSNIKIQQKESYQ